MTSGRFEPTPKTTLKRRAQRGSFDRAVVEAILDEGLVAHVGFAVGGQPCVLPMAYARRDGCLYLHGAASNHMLEVIAGGAPLCVTVTLLDGLVFARTGFRHSMNYRSVVAFGSARAIDDVEEKRAALDAIVDHVCPGRSIELRPATREEIAATCVLEMPLREASAKIRTGPPTHAPDELALNVWAGEVPIRQSFGAPIAAPDTVEHTPVSASILRRRGGDSKQRQLDFDMQVQGTHADGSVSPGLDDLTHNVHFTRE